MKIYISILLLIFSFFQAMAQPDDLCRKSTEGKNFWFGFMESRNYNPNHYVEITVTAREATTFKITIGSDEVPFNGTYTVANNNSVQVQIPWNLVEAIESEEIENKGIHLIAEKPVNLYALNWDQNSADVAVIYPIESLGNEYFAMCYYPFIDLNSAVSNGKNSEFLIVATIDSTKVDITPSKTTDGHLPKDSTFTVYLNKGEVYQVQSENEVDSHLIEQGDLTGSHIFADKPIAFYSGSLSTTIPKGVCCWDHLYEQIPPVRSWGREFYAAPLKTREYHRYRIIAAEDNTVVQITGRTPFVLNRGQFEEVVFSYTDAKRIYSDRPIMVAQYSESRNTDAAFTGGNGDPFMIILSSVTQSKNDVTFVTYKSPDLNISGYTGIEKYFVNIICLTSEIRNIRLNDATIINDFKTFPGGEYSYAQKEITQGTHRIFNTNKNRGFLAYVYGYGGVESYGYGVGFNLDLVLDLGENINFDGDTLLLCQGDLIELDAGPYFDTYNWNTGATSQKIRVTKGGKFDVEVTTIDGCELQDSIFVFMSPLKVELDTKYEEACFPFSIELDGNSGFEKYVWQNQYNDTLSTNQILIANKTDEYRITVFDEYQCAARDTMNLVVFPVPVVKIGGESLICGEKTTELSVLLKDAPKEVWNYEGSFLWSSNKTELQFSEEKHQSVKIETPEWGDYEIYYELTTINNCITRDTFLVRFYPTPTSNFNYVDNPDDECEGYYREVLYAGNATQNADYFWDYGGSQVIDSLDWNNFTVSLGAYNSDPFLQLYVHENGCWSDTTIKHLGANPDFILTTEQARGCDSMNVLFTGTLGVEDSLHFEWDFGDGSPINNSETIEHFYSESGFYDVSLTITNLLSQCQIGFRIDSMIKVFPTPTARIIADPLFCYTDSANIFYANSIDSSFCTWSFTAAHQTGNGNDSITMILEKPVATASLIVDEFGCISNPVETTLKRKPHFDFITDNETGCQPYSIEVIAQTNDNYLDYSWMTDSVPITGRNSNYYFYPDSGKFDIGLIAISNETNCTDTLIKQDWILVHPKPKADFEVDYQVALLEHSEITFTNYSRNAINYNWDFGDFEFSAEKHPKHNYNELGEYNTLLFAESDFGCLDTAELLITILPFDVYTPNAFRPNSDIAENRTFMPLGTGADMNRFTLQIYDRWGQLVFETQNPDNPWDGTSKNGSAAPMGNYVWIAHFFDIQGYEHNQKGQVLLVR